MPDRPSTSRRHPPGSPVGTGHSAACRRACASRALYFAPVAPLHAVSHSDPACAWSWSIEPSVRRLQVEFDKSVEITYVMAGIREISSGAAQARDWLEASAASGMPVDPRLWLDGGPTTSYPACLAIKAAAEQGDPAPFLRGVREGFAFRRRRLDHAEAFEGVAREVGGLDLDRL